MGNKTDTEALSLLSLWKLFNFTTESSNLMVLLKAATYVVVVNNKFYVNYECIWQQFLRHRFEAFASQVPQLRKQCNVMQHRAVCLSTVDGIWWMANDGGVAFRDRSLIFFAKRRRCRVTLHCLFCQRWLAKGEVVSLCGKIFLFLAKSRRCHVTLHCLFCQQRLEKGKVVPHRDKNSIYLPEKGDVT